MILAYDCTLRDGMQGEGMSLSVEEKVRVAHALDDLGVHVIEAGFPASNPKEAALFERLAGESFQAEISAFGMTRRRTAAAQHDPGLNALAGSFTNVCTLVGKTWNLHLEKVTRVSPQENLAMIADSVEFLVARGKRVIYDAEHFFDAWRDDAAGALDCLRAAHAAGAECLTLCDTNGATLPHEVSLVTAGVRAALGHDVAIGIHAHNDADCAVANTLAAVQAGATWVQGTLNGYGERCGNANLVSIIPNLQLKLGYECIAPERLVHLTATAHYVDELLNVVPDPDQAYVGKNAFAHKGGMHVAGVNADPSTFEHVDPASVGNARALLISELAGKGTVLSRAASGGLDLDDETAARVADRVKALEHAGFQFEAADGSFDLLIRRETGEYSPLFRLESWRVIAEKRVNDATSRSNVQTEATIKVWVDGERHVHTAEGNGPVNALDRALRGAIGDIYPHLAKIKLVNYKVRILDEFKATGAVTRVLLDASDGTDDWGAIGVHENVIEASWDALVDSLEAGMLPGRLHHERAGSPSAPHVPST